MIRTSDRLCHIVKYFSVRSLVILVVVKSVFSDDTPCLTGAFTDVQDWALEDGSLSPAINSSGYGLDLSNQPEVLTELRLLLLRFTSEGDYLMPEKDFFNFDENPIEIPSHVHEFTNDTLGVQNGELEISNFDRIIYLSLARNNLDRIPLFYIDSDDNLSSNWQKLKYLSLSGNHFSEGFSKSNPTSKSVNVTLNATDYQEINTGHYFSYSKEISNWALDLISLNFSNLIELDLRNCSIQTLHNKTFESLPNLRRLYLSDNKISQIDSLAFIGLRNLVHLDLSKNYEKMNFGISDGITIFPEAFVHLKSLKSLDFSNTKIVQTHLAVFEELSKNMERLSLCNTKFPHISNKIFQNKSLKYLDISGNVAFEFMDKDAFHGVEKTLEILFANDLSITHLGPLRNLHKLKVLSLVGNDISDIEEQNFSKFQNLEILDLSSNRITSWNKQVFSGLKRLELLNLRDNNLNLLSGEIMQDFSNLKYLSIGKNKLVCNCISKDFIKTAQKNFIFYNQSGDTAYFPDWFVNSTINSGIPNITIDPDNDDFFIELSQNINFHNAYINYSNLISEINFVRGTDDVIDLSLWVFQRAIEDKEKDDLLNFARNFSFLLLDYHDDDYLCTDLTSNSITTFFNSPNCTIESHRSKGERSSILVILLVTLSIIIMIVAIIIWKWWTVRYFFLTLKNIAILSIMGKERLIEDADKLFIYDVFTSYCDEDRQWVLDEFLPQIESHPQISACLHERDFQVGVSILDNIIYCMDRSRVLLMVVSNSFLMSQWCQFEMHLAQHRLLETMREQLILVLLEDIPRRKRPNTLHYLMMTKTYIVWPKKEKEKPLFWKRLKQSILNGKASENSSIA